MGMASGTRHPTDHQLLPRQSMLSELLPAERLKGFPTRESSRTPSGRIWPHGEFSYGYVRHRADGGEWHEDPYVGLGVDDVGMAERSKAGRQPLNLSDVPKSHNRPRRGLKGITSLGKQSVKAGGYLMRTRFPRHRMTFGTITLPPMPPGERARAVEAWPEVVRQTLQWLTRRLQRQGLPPIVVSVTEIQPKRLIATGEGYLHLHLLWLNRPGRAGNWAVNPVGLGAWFESLLRRQIGCESVGHVNVNVKPVKGDAARYLAKYMSKGGAVLAEALKDWGEDNCPRQWWNLTGPLRAMVKAGTATGASTGAWLECLVDYMFDTGDDSGVEFLRHIEIEFDGVAVTVGWRGRLADGYQGVLTDLLESH